MAQRVIFFQVEILKISNSLFYSLKTSNKCHQIWYQLSPSADEARIVCKSDLKLCKSHVHYEENRENQTSLGTLRQNISTGKVELLLPAAR